MTLRITTDSGAIYKIGKKFQRDYVIRENPNHEKRGDGEYQVLISVYPNPPEVGKRMVLEMESLIRYGSDDEGTAPEDAAPTTTRTTTIVRSIDEV